VTLHVPRLDGGRETVSSGGGAAEQLRGGATKAVERGPDRDSI
jgi:hypothetical protein